MKKTNTAFIRKVYDQFEHKDYTLATDNLNPLREINYYDTLDLDQIAEDLYAQVQARVTTIKEALDYKKATEETFTFDIAGQGRTPADQTLTDKELDNLNKAGTIGTDLFNLQNPTVAKIVGTDPLIKEIEKLIGSLMPLTKGPTTTRVNPPLSKPGKSSDPSRFPGGFPDTVPCGDINSDLDEDSSDTGTVDNTDTTSDDSAYDDETLEDKLSASAADFLKALEAKSQSTDQSLQTCAAQELEILKIIVIIVKICQVVNAICSYILGLIVPIVEVVQLAAGIWNNPSNIGVIIQKAIQTAIAAMAQVLSQLLSKLMAMLNANCTTQTSLSMLNSINQSLSASAAAFGEVSNTISFCGGKSLAVAKMIKQMGTTISDAKKQAIDQAKNGKKTLAAGLKGTGTATVSQLTSSADDLWNTVKDSELVQDSMNTISDAIGAFNAAKSALLGIADTFAENKKLAESTVNTLSTIKL